MYMIKNKTDISMKPRFQSSLEYFPARYFHKSVDIFQLFWFKCQFYRLYMALVIKGSANNNID